MSKIKYIFFLITTISSIATAVQSTSTGEISVAQVNEMLKKSSEDKIANQVLTAYLAGMGETISVVIKNKKIKCEYPLKLSDEIVRDALSSSKAQENTQETASTPIILDYILKKSKCK